MTKRSTSRKLRRRSKTQRTERRLIKLEKDRLTSSWEIHPERDSLLKINGITSNSTKNTEPSKIFINVKFFNSGFATRAIHCGNEPDDKFGGVAPAIDLSTTYAQPYPGRPVCFDYARCGNPTRLALERNLASLENAKYAFALNSGMSATITIMNILNSGDHVLCIDDVYGGT